MLSQRGFTLIEMVIVIVLLGVLAITAAPRLITITDDATDSTFAATVAAYKAGIQQVHLNWLMRGDGVAQQDFIKITDPEVGGDLSINSFGYPADTRGTSLTLNSQGDCIDVWKAILVTTNVTVGRTSEFDFKATYNGSQKCTYELSKDTSKKIFYDSLTGEVTFTQ
ncbi:type II secretion system protein [Pseudoalteromonas sp. SSDWG2]|uniref:type II secretion system protein n=1 Tax=Pseudoalteromonas sp. SSDWG2 TaxID=3139391 RepID=UPI003BAC2514